MGLTNLPTSGRLYLDAVCIICATEGVLPYADLFGPVWDAAAAGQFELVTSEMSMMECLVLPIRTGDAALEAEYEMAFGGDDICVERVTRPILRRAARLRAENVGLRAPDAIHVATSLETGCSHFITNDRRLRRLPGVSVVLLGLVRR